MHVAFTLGKHLKRACEAARLSAGGEQRGPAQHLLQRACDQLRSPGRGGKGLDQQTEVKQLFEILKKLSQSTHNSQPNQEYRPKIL